MKYAAHKEKRRRNKDSIAGEADTGGQSASCRGGTLLSV